MMKGVQLCSEDWLNLTKSINFTMRLWLFLLLRIIRTVQWQILKLAHLKAHFETQTLRDWRKHSKSGIANCLQAGRRLISCSSHKQYALWEGAKLVDAHMHYAWLIWELLFPRQFKTGLSDTDRKSFLALSFSLQTKINRTRCCLSSAIYLRDIYLFLIDRQIWIGFVMLWLKLTVIESISSFPPSVADYALIMNLSYMQMNRIFLKLLSGPKIQRNYTLSRVYWPI